MNTLKKLNYLFERKIKISFIFIFIMIVIGSAVELLGVAIVLPIVNLAIDENFSENKISQLVMQFTGLTDREEILLFLIVVTICIYIFKAFYLSWMNSTLYGFAAVVKKSLATKLMKAYLVQPYSYFLKKNSSELIRSINSDTAQLYEVVINVMLIASNGLTALSLLVMLIVLNPVMALLVAVLLVICAVAVLLVVQKRTRSYGRKNQQLSGNLIKYLQQAFEGIKEIKILGNEAFFIERYGDTYQKQAAVEKKSKLVNLIPKYLIETVCIIGIMAYLGINVAFNDNYMALIPQLAAFVAAAYKLLPSVNSVYAYMNTIIYHRASIDLVYNDIKEANELVKQDVEQDNIDCLRLKEAIRFNHVTYNYENSEKLVLNDVSFEIPNGKSVAFIGPSGGGKTTTADILIGLLKPTKGTVEIDGLDIQKEKRAWRNNIGYIPQSIYLTDDSIKCNVALGIDEKNIDIDKVNRALEEAQLSDFIKSLDQGIETKVGERGTRISGGQRQRIGIARALYRNPDILVFDEATSALDNETEKEVMKAIDSLHGNKTMIMIAHRLSTIENCDIVYKVENGKVTKER